MLQTIRGCTALRLAYELATRVATGRTIPQARPQSPSREGVQSAMGDQKALIRDLSEEIQQELKDSAAYVQEASYPTDSTTEGYSVCNEVEPLVERFPKVLALLSSEVHASFFFNMFSHIC